ncbi:MAG TPA: hypothetical protein VFB99_06860 [Vicinamibacterales bacterium]|nr:hypothetical protein [Vicinamibacterales bacterium]
MMQTAGNHTLRNVSNAAAVVAMTACAVAAAWKLGAFEPVMGCVRADAWPAELIALHTVADALVFIAYIWIPTVLILIYLRLKARPAADLLYLFGAFIVLCGWTHLDSIITTWFPAYWYSGGVKLLTGLVSIATAVRLTGLYKPLVGLGSMAADLQAAKDEADRLRREAEARATRAEGDVTELEQALAREKAALAKAEKEKERAEKEKAEADRLRRDALESAHR